jgi:uncharacterized cupredoxin-like copper-binding protein
MDASRTAGYAAMSVGGSATSAMRPSRHVRDKDNRDFAKRRCDVFTRLERSVAVRAGLAISFVGAVAACAAPASTTTGDRTIEIEMRDFAFSPDSLTLRAGERITLSFKNVGKLEHEFMAGTQPAYGKGYLEDLLTGAHIEGGAEHGMDHPGTGIRVAPNTTKAFTFVVPERNGVFEFGCFVVGHYESGMHGRLVIDVKVPTDGGPGSSGPGQRQPSGAPTHPPMDDDGEGH